MKFFWIFDLQAKYCCRNVLFNLSQPGLPRDYVTCRQRLRVTGRALVVHNFCIRLIIIARQGSFSVQPLEKYVGRIFINRAMYKIINKTSL